MTNRSFDPEQPAYKALRAITAERTSSLVAWVGSGLSVPAGLPSWGALRSRLQEALVHKVGALSGSDAKQIKGKLIQAERAANPWLAFQILEDGLGAASFRDTVKEALAPRTTARPPDAYPLLWKLPMTGVLNLNLDRLATRAYAQQTQNIIHEFSGRDAGGFVHLLKSPQPFVVNLHGVVEDAFSWVLTARALKNLVENAGYRTFIASVFSSRTVVFLGVTADDTAAGGHLAHLTQSGIDVGSHFWVTHRTDLATDRWAEGAGLRVIRYTVTDEEDHSGLIELLHDLVSFSSKDQPAPPVVISQPPPARPLPPPEELVAMPADEIRQILNARAAEILKSDRPHKAEEYAEFAELYEEAIYRAWFVTTKAPRNVLLGYRLERERGRGAFARVFEATSPTGEPVAIKVLHEGVRRRKGMLESFRRGVRSMRILWEHGVNGMVPYREASEIPAFAVMDLIQGPNLDEAVASGFVRDWSTILRIGVDLVNVIRSGHSLPERVLHRDIRPANIMLKGYYADPLHWELVVLDFDLSWHQEALGDSVLPDEAVFSYLAPEQLDDSSPYSTRNAAVDSYGLGMTLLFLGRGTDPSITEPLSAGWEDKLRSAFRSKRRSAEWKSLPRRFARLVVNATRDKQPERWDLGQIQRELERLRDAVDDPSTVSSAELWADEIAEQSEVVESYQWLADRLTALLVLPSGVEIRLRARETEASIEIEIGWASAGLEERKRVVRWIVKAADQAAAALRRGSWDVKPPDAYGLAVVISGRIAVDQLREARGVAASRGIAEAAQHLTFA